MKPIFHVSMLWTMLLIFSTVSRIFAVDLSSAIPATGFGDTDIKNSYVIDMNQNPRICINGSVRLVAPKNISNVLSYKWINKTTGKVISTDSSVWVYPTETTEYELRVTHINKEDERINNWDFSKGRVDFYSAHTYVSKTGDKALWDEGKYAVGTNPRNYHENFASMGDHTNGRGNMMIINGAPGSNVKVWEQAINGIVPGNQYAFVMWGMALTPDNPAVLRFSINGDGTALDKFYLANTATWQQFYRIWTAPAGNYSSITISLLNNVTERSGNDFAIDDFSFSPVENAIGTVTVRVVPKIEVARLENVRVCEGDNLRVDAVLAAGSEITKYEWKKDGNVLSTDNYLTITTANVVRDNGSYTCTVTGICGYDAVDFDIAVRDTLKVNELENVTACVNKPLTLAVEVAGYNPTYEWMVPRPNGWSPRYMSAISKANISALDEGTYSCKVSNWCGSKKVSAVLTLAQDLKIVGVSPDAVVCRGESVKFWVKPNLTDVSVKWTCPNGSIVMGDTLYLYDIKLSDRGTYVCTVESRNCGTIQPRAVNLDVHAEQSALTVTSPQSVCEGKSVTMEANVTGYALQYLWSGPNGFSSTAQRITVVANNASVGTYRVVVTDGCGKQQSAQTQLSLLNEFTGLRVTPPAKVCPNSTYVFEVTGGASTLLYEWTTPLGIKVNAKNLTLRGIQAGDAGEYVCRVTGSCKDTLLRTNLEVYKVVTAMSNAGSQDICEGRSVSFWVKDGEGVTYSWDKDGGALTEKGATLKISGVRQSDAGVYRCTVSDMCREKPLYYFYTLKVNPKVKITGKSVDKDLAEHESLYLYVTTEGSDLSYTWKCNGVVTGDNSSKLVVADAGGSGDYVYTCTVVGACGTDEAVIKVHVGKYNVVTDNVTVDLCESQNFVYKLSAVPSGCTAGADLSYSWSYNGEVVSNTAVLQLTALSAQGGGVYTGVVTGSCGRVEVQLNAVVKELPKIGGMTNNNVLTNDTIVLCGGDNAHIAPVMAAGVPSVIEWFREGVAVGTGAVYHITDAVPGRDYARYVCRVATDCGGTDTRSFVVIVRRKLKVVEYPKSVPACIGETVALTVVTSGYEEKYTWSGPGIGWTSPQVNVYRKEAVGLQDKGTYRCVITSMCGTATVYSTLDVAKELLITRVAEIQKVCKGTPVDIFVTTNMDSVTYKWTLPNGTVKDLSRFTVRPTAVDTGWYSYEVKSRCYTKTGRVHLEIYRPLSGLSVTGVSPVCENTPATIQSSVTGDKLVYRWMGPNRFVSSDANITIPNMTAAKTGKYELSVTDACSESRTASFVMSLVTDVDDLSLNAKAAIVCPGKDMVLEVRGGSASLTYVWKFNGVLVGNSSRLPLNNIQASQEGEYVCEVTGQCKTVSLQALLTVRKPLSAVAKESLVRVCPATPARFEVIADGVNILYQWMRNGSEVGYRTSELLIDRTIPADEGMYECRVTSACGSVVVPFELRLKTNTKIKKTSPDKFVCEFDPTLLSVTAVGENNRYTWFQDGEQLACTDPMLYVENVGTVDTLVFTAVVAGDCGTDTAEIRIKIGAFKPMRGATDTLCEGSNYTYVMDVVPVFCYGNENFVYTWYKVGTGDTLSHTQTLKFTDVSFADEGMYACHVKEECGDTTVYVNIKVMGPPTITSITEDTFVAVGDNHVISVEAEGGKLKYGWSKDNMALVGKNKDLYLTKVTKEDEGRYRVKVSNQCGVAEAFSELGIWEETTVISPLERDTTVCVADSICFNVEAIGEPGLMYYWYHDGVLMSVPYVSRLQIDSVKPSDAGVYLCYVSGRGGIDSCRINLTVNGLPSIGILGDKEMCQNDTKRIYTGESNDGRVAWRWDVSGGEFMQSRDRQETEIVWNGKEKAVVGLTVVSLNTGCRKRVEENVTFRLIPDLNLAAPEMVGICRDSLMLDFAYPSGGVYTWGGRETDCIYFQDKEVGYEVTYYYEDMSTLCHTSEKDTIYVDEAPYLEISGDSVVTGACRPVVLNIDRHSEGDVKWLPTLWLSADTVFSPLFTPGESQGYYSVLTDKYGCRASDSVFVTVMELPEISVTADTTIGECNSIMLACYYYSAYFKELQWSPSEQLNVDEDYQAEVVAKAIGENVYVATVSDLFDCVVSDTVVVNVKETERIVGRKACISDGPIVVDCSGYSKFEWKDGNKDMVRELTEAGDYVLQTNDRFGCPAETVIEIHPVPLVALVDTFIFERETFVRELTPDPKYGPYDVRWSDGSGSLVFTTDKEGNYSVVVKDNNGCTVSDEAFLEVKKRAIAAPNAFTPGSGGDNSKFYLKEVNFVGRFEMLIYDRWGEMVYKTSEIGMNGGWDGSFKGMDCLGGAYVWVAYADGEIVGRGMVVLVK